MLEMKSLRHHFGKVTGRADFVMNQKKPSITARERTFANTVTNREMMHFTKRERGSASIAISLEMMYSIVNFQIILSRTRGNALAIFADGS